MGIGKQMNDSGGFANQVTAIAAVAFQVARDRAAGPIKVNLILEVSGKCT